ncbi:MAG: AraC family transcriptional regulator [Dokdonella sp.]
MPRHQHDEASLCIVVAGRYEERIRGHAVEHAAGHLLYCPAFEPHAQQFAHEGALKILIEPAPAALDYLGRHLSLAQAPYAQSTAIGALGGRLLRELAGADTFSTVVVQGLLLESLGFFARADAGTATGTRAPAWLPRAIDFIETHAEVGFSLAELAHTLDRHPVHVSREFRRVHGRTIGDYVRELRVRRAAVLLAASRKPLGEIALICGFFDQAHLTRSFKAVLKTTPANFRRNVG